MIDDFFFLPLHIYLLIFLVSSILNVLPPPSVQYQQLTVSGKHLIVLKGKQATKKHMPKASALL